MSQYPHHYHYHSTSIYPLLLLQLLVLCITPHVASSPVCITCQKEVVIHHDHDTNNQHINNNNDNTNNAINDECPSNLQTVVYHEVQHHPSADPLLDQHNTVYPLTFISIGDWGQINQDQHDVAQQLATSATQYNVSFILNTGDNFYEDGVTSLSDDQWKRTYEDVYASDSLQVDWYSIQGNHDHHWGRGSAEIDYSIKKCDHRWVMPDYWYFKQFHIDLDNDINTAQDNIIIDVTFIDTYLLTEADFDNGTSIPDELKQRQWEFIEKSLTDSYYHNDTYTHWRMVVGHYPVFTGGEHGNTDELVERLQPMLEKYHVDLYLCGHDHTLQHLIDSHGIEYYVSGNGAKRGTYIPVKQSIFGDVDPGFMIHSLNHTHMYTQVIDKQGKIIYHTIQQSRASQYNTVIHNPNDDSLLSRYFKPVASKYAVRAPLLRTRA